jgi:signal transduction histidine kinase/CheY-like chemotaxis protein
MVRKDNTDLLTRINAAITEMDNNYPDWRSELWNKYYQADTGSEIAFTAAERKYLSSLKTAGTKLTAVVDPDRIPYSYFENGKAKGIMPEILHRIEEATGLSFEIQETASRQAYHDLLSSDQHIDVRIDTFADYYQAEVSGYKLTDTYLTINIDKVSGKINSGIAAIVKDGDETAARKDLLTSGVTLLYCDSYDECIQAVKDGRAEYTYLYSYTAQHYVDEDTSGSLKAVTLPQYSVQYALGVAVDSDPCLLTILDKAVNHVQGEITQKVILEQTNITIHSSSIFEYLKQNPILLVIVFTFVGLMIGLIILSLYRHRSMHLIAQKNTDLETAIHEAETANAAKSTFLSSMSHDMRTPLNGIISFTNFALNTKDSIKKQEYLSKVQKSSLVLKNLVNDTLNVSRIESGKATLNLQYASTKEIYENLTVVIAAGAQEKGIAFHTTTNVPEDLYVNIDKMKMQEIFMNLLSNAIKYTPKGGDVWYDVRYEPNTETTGTFTFIIKDNGIGMSEDFQKKMFESFTQEKPNTKTAEGTGLGLYIAKRYVDLMNGTITVKSASGKGSVFTVIIQSEVKHVTQVEKEVNHNYDFTGVHILLAEDNIFNQEIAKTLLNEKGALVDVAENGQEAVDRFCASAPGWYKAVFMDIHMPVLNGFEATQIIRAMERSDAAKIPIIAMTADAYDQDVKNCLDHGMNAHVAKPIDTEQLYSQLDQLLQKEKESAS